MSDELINDDGQIDDQGSQQQTDDQVKKPVRSDNRFKDLSEKVETTAKERDDAKALAETATKEVEFYKDFSKLKYDGKEDFLDKIKEKVLAGYEMEDAAISVMAKAGKLQNAPQQRQSPAGGSASTAIQAGDDKPVGDMSAAEKRAKLVEIERTDPGALSQTLRSLNL